MATFTKLLMPRPLFDAMLEHASRELPNECCGLLAGAIEGGVGCIRQHLPIRNELASPTEYLTNARDLLDAMKATRSAGTEILAIYHSHPASTPVPSRRDIERNEWGAAAAHVIIGLAGGSPEVRAWWLAEEPEELELVRPA